MMKKKTPPVNPDFSENQKNIEKMPSSVALAFADRLKLAMKTRTIRSIADECGVAHTTIRSYLAGKTTPDLDIMVKIAKATGAHHGWLATGQNTELASPEDALALASSFLGDGLIANQNKEHIFLSKEEYAAVPRLTVSASAGGGVLVDEEHLMEFVVLARKFLRDELGVPPEQARVIQVRGDSMRPALEPGWLVIVDIRPVTDLDNGIYVVGVGEHLLIKRVVMDVLDGSISLLSDNPKYPPKVIRGDEVMPRFVGRVAGVLSRAG